MNIGEIVNTQLIKAELSNSDLPTIDLAKYLLNEVIQENWEAEDWKFKESEFELKTTQGVDEYTYHKYADNIVPNTFKGTDPKRRIRFQPKSYFDKKHSYALENGKPYWYRDGQMLGFQNNVSAASPITFKTSLANYTTGTVTVVNGSNRVIIATGTASKDMEGKWIRVGSDDKEYLVTKFVNDGNNNQVLIHQGYEGVDGDGLNYVMGDIQQKGVVTGVLTNGSIITEEVQLNGSTDVVSTNSFASILRISKSDETIGYMTATSNGGVVTNVVLNPGELEADFKTFFLYPIPEEEEKLKYWATIKHPQMYKDAESPLFPSKYHNLLAIDLYIRLMEEVVKAPVPNSVLVRREKIFNSMVSENNDLSDFEAQTERENESDSYQGTNLPTNYGIGYGY